MIMKRFLAISTLVLAAAGALACGPWFRPHYYTFSAFNRNQMGQQFTERLNQYWKIYDSSIDDYAMSSLSWVNLENFDTSTNEIIAAARKKGDTEMQLYLRLLITYLQECDKVDVDNEWAYPTKLQMKQHNAKLDYIFNAARTYEGTRLRPQYCLLLMRSLMLKGDNQAIVKYWGSTGVKLPPSVYRDMMQDIYAGALLRTGSKAEACRIYAGLGDMQSIKWVMRNERDLEGIQKEYAADPNAPTLIFLVQDYVNNAEETLKAQNEQDNVSQEMAAFNRQLEEFKVLAQQAVKNKNCKNQALWQSALGYIQHLQGDNNAAIASLEKAVKMDGTQRMRDNARACLIVAQTDAGADNNKFYNLTAKNINWLTDACKAEPGDAGSGWSSSNHYSEVLQNVVYDQLVPKFKDWGKIQLSTALLGWMQRYEQSLNNYTAQEQEESATAWFSGNYGEELDMLSAEEMISYGEYLRSKPTNDLERLVLSGSKTFDENWFNDIVGTKLLREGQFTAAISYLEKVPVSYINRQGIARYMAARDYNVERWFKRQVVDRSWDDIYNREPNKTVTENQKLQFCRDVMSIVDRINFGGNATARDYYRLANLYFQASYEGDCWYLARYRNSMWDTICYKNEMDFLAEAVQMLDKAQQMNKAAFDSNDEQAYDLQQRILYARAFIPFGEELTYTTWDANYNATTHYNKQAHQYQALLELSNFYSRYFYRGVEPYISKCDVLKQFRAQN